MDIKDRIKELMEYEQMTAAAFAESIGVAQATISHTLGDRNKYPSTDFIMRLHDRYKYVNLNWLLTGTGSMIEGDVKDAPEEDYPLFNTKEHNSNTGDEKQVVDIYEDNVPSKERESITSMEISKSSTSKRVTEIRIFFDDNTYEIFKPEK